MPSLPPGRGFAGAGGLLLSEQGADSPRLRRREPGFVGAALEVDVWRCRRRPTTSPRHATPTCSAPPQERWRERHPDRPRILAATADAQAAAGIVPDSRPRGAGAPPHRPERGRLRPARASPACRFPAAFRQRPEPAANARAAGTNAARGAGRHLGPRAGAADSKPAPGPVRRAETAGEASAGRGPASSANGARGFLAAAVRSGGHRQVGGSRGAPARTAADGAGRRITGWSHPAPRRARRAKRRAG